MEGRADPSQDVPRPSLLPSIDSDGEGSVHSLNNIIEGAPEWADGLQLDRRERCRKPE